MSDAVSYRGILLAPLTAPVLWIGWTVATTRWPIHEYLVFGFFVLIIGYVSALVVGGVALSLLRVLNLHTHSYITGAGAFCGAVVLQGFPLFSGGAETVNVSNVFEFLSIELICLGALLGASTAGVYCWLGRLTSAATGR